MTKKQAVPTTGIKLSGSVIMYRTALSCFCVSALFCTGHIVPISQCQHQHGHRYPLSRDGQDRPARCPVHVLAASSSCFSFHLTTRSATCRPSVAASIRSTAYSRTAQPPVARTDSTSPLTPSLSRPLSRRSGPPLPLLYSAPQSFCLKILDSKGNKTHHAILGKRVAHQPAQLDPFPLILARTLSTALDEILVALLN